VVLVTPIEDLDDRYRTDACVLPTQTMPRSQPGVSQGVVPAADDGLDLLGGWKRDLPRSSPPAGGAYQRLTARPVLAWTERQDGLAARDEPHGKVAVLRSQPVGFRVTECMPEGDSLAMAGHERERADLFPRQTNVLADAAGRRRVREALVPLACHVPSAGTESPRVISER
jgi:hypothetical protein